MPSRHWGHYAALGGLIAALVLCGAAVAQNALDRPNSAIEAQRAKDEAPSAKPKPPPVPTAAPPDQTPKTTRAQPQAEPSKDQGGKPRFLTNPLGWLGAWIFDPDNFSDFLMVLFTLALTVVAFKQHFLEEKLATDTADSINIAKQSADAATRGAEAASESVAHLKGSERAHLVMVGAGFEFEEVVPGFSRMIFSWKIKNVGRTPGFVKKVPLGYALDQPPPPVPPFAPAPEDANRIVYAPGEEHGMHTIRMDGGRLLSNAEVQRYADGAGYIHLFGAIHYDDVFGDPHVSGFCFYVGYDNGVCVNRRYSAAPYWQYT